MPMAATPHNYGFFLCPLWLSASLPEQSNMTFVLTTIIMWSAVILAGPYTAAWGSRPSSCGWAYLVNSVYGYTVWEKGVSR